MLLWDVLWPIPELNKSSPILPNGDSLEYQETALESIHSSLSLGSHHCWHPVNFSIATGNRKCSLKLNDRCPRITSFFSRSKTWKQTSRIWINSRNLFECWQLFSPLVNLCQWTIKVRRLVFGKHIEADESSRPQNTWVSSSAASCSRSSKGTTLKPSWIWSSP